MQRNSFLAGFLAAALAFATTGATGATKALAADAAQEKTVNMAIFWLDGDIDPISAWHGWTLTRTGVGENLVQVDENLQFKPSIAEKWEQTDERTTRFIIRDGVTFHNGRTVDAAACKASLERALNESDRADIKFPVESISAEGRVLTIKTKQAYPTLLNMLADTVFIIVDAEAAKQAGPDFKFKPICTGAFKVESFSPQTGLVLSAHQAHWKGKPKVDRVNAKYISDAKSRSMALQSGELDFAAQIMPADLPILQKDPKLQVLSGPNLRIFLLRINMAHPIMHDPVFRQALHYAIQKDVYAEKIAHGIPARGPFSEVLDFGHRGADSYPYNPEKAKALLDQLGYRDSNGDGIREFQGKNIVLQYLYATNHGAEAKNIGIAMQQDLKKVGIGLETQQMENYASAAQAGKFDFLYERWTSAPAVDPQYFLDSAFKTGSSSLGAGNVGRYSNKALDALIDEMSTVSDREKRNELGRKGAQILMDDVAAIFLFYQTGNVVYNKRIDGIHRFVSEIYYIDDRLRLAQ